MYNDLSGHLSQIKGVKSCHQTKRTLRIIHLKQIIQSRNTKAEIGIGNNIEYGVSSYQAKKTIVKSTEVRLKGL